MTKTTLLQTRCRHWYVRRLHFLLPANLLTRLLIICRHMIYAICSGVQLKLSLFVLPHITQIWFVRGVAAISTASWTVRTMPALLVPVVQTMLRTPWTKLGSFGIVAWIQKSGTRCSIYESHRICTKYCLYKLLYLSIHYTNVQETTLWEI